MVSSAFGKLGRQFKFVGGPMDGDALAYDRETYWVEVPDARKPHLFHMYHAVGDTLQYRGTADKLLSERSKDKLNDANTTKEQAND